MCPAKSVQSVEIASSRPLLLRHDLASLDVALFISPELWAEAESARDNFRPPASEKLTEAELILCFLKHAKQMVDYTRSRAERGQRPPLRWRAGADHQRGALRLVDAPSHHRSRQQEVGVLCAKGLHEAIRDCELVPYALHSVYHSTTGHL